MKINLPCCDDNLKKKEFHLIAMLKLNPEVKDEIWIILGLEKKTTSSRWKKEEQKVHRTALGFSSSRKPLNFQRIFRLHRNSIESTNPGRHAQSRDSFYILVRELEYDRFLSNRIHSLKWKSIPSRIIFSILYL